MAWFAPRGAAASEWVRTDVSSDRTRTDMRAIARPPEAARRGLNDGFYRLTVVVELTAVIAAETANPIGSNWENLCEWSDVDVLATGREVLPSSTSKKREAGAPQAGPRTTHLCALAAVRSDGSQLVVASVTQA